jgi:hypothetical protein
MRPRWLSEKADEEGSYSYAMTSAADGDAEPTAGAYDGTEGVDLIDSL